MKPSTDRERSARSANGWSSMAARLRSISRPWRGLAALAFVLALMPVVGSDGAAAGSPYSTDGWTTQGVLSTTTASPGQSVTVQAVVTSRRSSDALVDL